MAFSNYHEKFRQIGTDPNSYESWVDSKALTSGLERLRNLMNSVYPSSNHEGNNDKLAAASAFEQELSIDFADSDCIKEENNGRTIVGVAGVCDWINEERARSTGKEKKEALRDVDLLEIKFVHHLSNMHRLQVLVYTALCALEANNVKAAKCSTDDDEACSFDADEYEWKVEYCRGMLYNARTGEKEICMMKSRDALDFLLDISQFKYNGKDRTKIKKEKTVRIPKIEMENKDCCSAIKNGNSWTRQSRKRKKRLVKNTGTSFYTPLCIEDDDDDNHSKKRPKDNVQSATGDGTGADPIILD